MNRTLSWNGRAYRYEIAAVFARAAVPFAGAWSSSGYVLQQAGAAGPGERGVVVMAERLPTTTELKSAFGGKGVVGQTRSVFQALRDEEARGRNLREVQLKDNCSFQWMQLAVFDRGGQGRSARHRLDRLRHPALRGEADLHLWIGVDPSRG